MKELEGKEVYLRPEGSNRHTHSSKIIKATILKVARVNVTFKIEGSGFEQKLRIDNSDKYRIYTKDWSSNGYTVYKNKAAIDEHYEIIGLSSRISKSYRYEMDYARIGVEKLRQVAKILNV